MKKLLSVLIIALLLLMIKNIVVSIKNLSENDSTVSRLTQELQQKMREHEFLTQKLAYVKSDEFIDQEAREKLNLVRVGEHVVIGPGPEIKKVQSIPPKKEPPNWQKWFSLFF